MNELRKCIFEFNLKTRTKFGVGIATSLGKYLKELSLERIGIIIDSGVSDQKYVKGILEALRKEQFTFLRIWKYNLKREPDYDSLDRVKKKFLDENSHPTVDCFVGIGGGSVIDFAKGLATLVVNPGKALAYRGFPTDLNPSLPTIALPTTGGTGSEVTYNAVFIDRKQKVKLGINTMNNFPILAILDPALTLGCPRSVTLSSGMDALVHTVESYAAVQSNSLTKIFSREAFKHLFANLQKVLDDPTNIEIRAHLQFGSYLAGIALMNSGSGPAAALSYPLGVHFNVPHGLAGAVFLSHIIEHNVKRGYDYSELSDMIDNTNKSRKRRTQKAKNQLFSQRLHKLCNELGVPSSLREFGANENNIHVLLNETERLEKAFAQNPVPFSVGDGKRLLMSMI